MPTKTPTLTYRFEFNLLRFVRRRHATKWFWEFWPNHNINTKSQHVGLVQKLKNKKKAFCITMVGDALFDWCETNYEISDYIAEFFNTITNSIYVIVGIWTFLEFNNNNIFSRLQYCGIALILVGLGSFAYHGTITRWGQACDELAILYWEVSVLFSLFEKSQSFFNKWYFYLLLAILETALYWQMDKYPVIGWAIYHPLHTAIDLSSFGILYYKTNYQYNCTVGNQLFKNGVILIVIAFISWGLDMWFCDIFRNYYLHAFGWHLFSGMAIAHFHLGLALLVCLENNVDTLKLRYLKFEYHSGGAIGTKKRK